MPSTTLSAASAERQRSTADLALLQQQLGYCFRDLGLLELAFRHRSWCAEQEGPSNERLEFLGDSVLGLAVTDHAFRDNPALSEGQLAKIRSAVVSSANLARVARNVCLGDYLLLGRGEELSGGREKPSILADALEAVIGAVYLDAGWEDARSCVLRLVRSHVQDAAERPGVEDFKTRLQELLARRSLGAPRYVMSDEGPDHDKCFEAAVEVDGVAVGRGAGKSKKQAQQAAAADAWQHLTAVTGEDDAPVDNRGEEGTDDDARAT